MITIRFLEKPSKKHLLVSWREQAKCNYTEQLWTLRKAAKATTCALSGEKIKRGDYVYRPAGQALNSGNCIRAEAVALV